MKMISGRQKALIFRGLACLPNAIGDWIYHGLQSWCGRVSVEQILADHRRTLRQAEQVLSRLDFSLDGRDAVEIGSGWVPATPYLLRFVYGCRSVRTFDLNRHYSRKRIARLNQLLTAEIESQEGMSAVGEWGLYSGIEYYPNLDISRAGEFLGQPRFVMTRDVLEHVAPEGLVRMHQELRRCLGPDGLVLHFVRPGDHRSEGDPNMSLYDFLQYDSETWRGKHTRFDYQNRYRLPDYRRLFRETGFEIVFESYQSLATSSRLREHYERAKIHLDFKKNSDVENSAATLVFGLR